VKVVILINVLKIF